MNSDPQDRMSAYNLQMITTRYCRRLPLLLVAFCALGSVFPFQNSEPPPYRDASRPVEERVRDLLGRMTLEEKFWQLFMIPGDLDNPANDYSHGIFGLQISSARRPAADRTTRPRRRVSCGADQRHPTLLCRKDEARHSDSSLLTKRYTASSAKERPCSRRRSRWPRPGTRLDGACCRCDRGRSTGRAASAMCSPRW